jgi:DNA-binding Lrp family transcriptional regulator
MIIMDEIDSGMIAILRKNARTSVSEMAAQLGVTRATVRSRLDKLLADGEIVGFTAILKSDAQDLPVRGVMLIEIEGKGTERIITQLSGLPEVQTIHTTNGRWDLVIELGTRALPDLDSVLRRIRSINGIANSETNLYLSTRRSSRQSDAQRHTVS